MTSRSTTAITEVAFEGVMCQADAVVVMNHEIQFLSIYGAAQQTKALFSALAGSRFVEVAGNRYNRPNTGMRYKGFSIGWGKSHGVIYSEEVGNSLILWSSIQEKERRLRQILSRRRIPYAKKDLPLIERLLLDFEYLSRLEPVVGVIDGYYCEFNDNEICDHLIRTIYKNHEKANVAA
jgi:hypothetical protein